MTQHATPAFNTRGESYGAYVAVQNLCTEVKLVKNGHKTLQICSCFRVKPVITGGSSIGRDRRDR